MIFTHRKTQQENDEALQYMIECSNQNIHDLCALNDCHACTGEQEPPVTPDEECFYKPKHLKEHHIENDGFL